MDERASRGTRTIAAKQANGEGEGAVGEDDGFGGGTLEELARSDGPTALAADAALAEARAVGFDLAGVVTDPKSRHMAHLRRWIGAGRHGRMSYLSRADALARRADLARTLPAFRSAIVVAQSYACAGAPEDREGVGDAAPPSFKHTEGPTRAGARDRPTAPSFTRTKGPPEPEARGPAGEGRAPRHRRSAGEALVARYARGLDYHGVVTERLRALAGRLGAQAGQPFEWRAYVDTGPLLERELAQRAGLGWFGKNTMLIHPRKGSYFFLGALLTDLPLSPSPPFPGDHCGTCRRCLDACPTGALLGRDASGAPVMDATRCISYLTIELKGFVPRDLRPAIGNWVFGCDVCQAVCPWNAKLSAPADPAYAPRAGFDREPLARLAERLLRMSGKQFQREFAGSPATRAGRNGLLRNVCVALGNWGAADAVPVLLAALDDRAPLVRGHAAWALGRIGTPEARQGLQARAATETDAAVLDELAAAK